jgi:hypothetical protein
MRKRVLVPMRSMQFNQRCASSPHREMSIPQVTQSTLLDEKQESPDHRERSRTIKPHRIVTIEFKCNVEPHND